MLIDARQMKVDFQLAQEGNPFGQPARFEAPGASAADRSQ